jgi:DNA-binding MltR family transcriptional regulator
MSQNLSKEDSAALQWFPVFNESDRGIVIASVAILDDALRKLIIAKMSADDHHIPGKIHKFRDKLFAPESQGCFSSLFAKYQIAYGMGWIEEETHQDIKVIAKLRNLAAHDPEHFRFEGDDVIKLLRKLSSISENGGEDLLAQSGLCHMHTGSDIDYAIGGTAGKIAFIQAVSGIADEIEMLAHYARNPPPGSVKLKRGDLVSCSYGWEKGKMAIVLSPAKSNGMVECRVLGLSSFSDESESNNLYCYDLDLQQFPDLPDHCDLEVGDEVELEEANEEMWFSRGVIESIDPEFRTVTARSSGLIKGIFRAFWGEFRKAGL